MRGTLFACLALLILSVGCAEHTADPKQIAWHDRLTLASNKTSDARANGKRLSVQSLIGACGPPDVKTTVDQLRQTLAASGAPMADRGDLNTLYFAYRISKNLSAEQTDQWQSDQEFLATPVWIYDERQHFRSPLPDSSGFDSFVFLLSDDQLIGSNVIIASPVWGHGQ